MLILKLAAIWTEAREPFMWLLSMHAWVCGPQARTMQVGHKLTMGTATAPHGCKAGGEHWEPVQSCQGLKAGVRSFTLSPVLGPSMACAPLGQGHMEAWMGSVVL